MTVHDRVQDLASAALDFDLTVAERAELDDHLASCAACAAFAAGLRRDVEAASAWPQLDVPVRVRQTVYAAFDGPTSIGRPQAAGRLSLGLAVLLLAILAWLAFVVGSSRGPSGLLAVIEGNSVYTVDPSSLERSMVATASPPSSGDDLWPVRWSRDGRRLFFADGRSVNADGTDPIQATYLGGAWSPDGSRYAVQAGNRGVAIAIVNRSGADVTAAIPLPPGVGNLVGVPTWSPDGHLLAIVGCSLNPCPGLDQPGVTGSLWVVAVDGSSVHQLTAPTPSIIFPPTWSPDGTRIAYQNLATTVTCKTPVSLIGGGSLCVTSSRLFVATVADGSTLEILSASTFEGSPAWSPDGRTIAFQGSATDETTRIEVANADGSSVRPISAGSYGDILPAWSGDGRWLAYASSRSAKPSSSSDFDLWIIRPDGSGARKVVAGTYSFDWQPRR